MPRTFIGVIDVNNTTNVIEAVYEIISGVLATNNLLISSGMHPPCGLSTNPITSFSPAGNIVTGSLTFPVTKATFSNGTFDFDNAYVSGWKQFSQGGALLYGLSQFQNTYVRIYSRNSGDALITNIGRVIYFYNGFFRNFSATIEIVESALVSNVCFPKDTMVLCDQGWFKIQELTNANTFGGFGLVAVTETVSKDDHLIEFNPNCFSVGSPCQTLRISKDHLVLKAGNLEKASSLPEGVKVAYNGETLYNVLLEVHGLMNVQDVGCETLHPENSVAKYYRATVKPTVQEHDFVLKNEVYA